MPINGNAPLGSKGEFKNAQTYYTSLDNFLISLVIWGVLPLRFVDWYINRGGKHHE